MLLAITRELYTYNSQGNEHKTQIIIEFTIAVTSKAVAEANDALVPMKLAPSPTEPMQGTVNTSVAVVTNINSLTTTWEPLLETVKLFTEFVDKIAHVSSLIDDLSAVSDSRGDRISRSTHMPIWRGASSPLCLRFVLRIL